VKGGFGKNNFDFALTWGIVGSGQECQAWSQDGQPSKGKSSLYRRKVAPTELGGNGMRNKKARKKQDHIPQKIPNHQQVQKEPDPY